MTISEQNERLRNRIAVNRLFRSKRKSIPSLPPNQQSSDHPNQQSSDHLGAAKLAVVNEGLIRYLENRQEKKIDIINKYLEAMQYIAVTIGVIVAAIAAVLAYDTLLDTRKVASANLTLELRKRLNDKKYSDLSDLIQSSSYNHRIAYFEDKNKEDGLFPDNLVAQYISMFEDIGYLAFDARLLDEEMVYNYFSYDIEKAWCNIDVSRIMEDAQNDDKSANSSTNPIYGHFAKLALGFLAREQQSCSDLDEQ